MGREVRLSTPVLPITMITWSQQPTSKTQTLLWDGAGRSTGRTPSHRKALVCLLKQGGEARSAACTHSRRLRHRELQREGVGERRSEVRTRSRSRRCSRTCRPLPTGALPLTASSHSRNRHQCGRKRRRPGGAARLVVLTRSRRHQNGRKRWSVQASRRHGEAHSEAAAEGRGGQASRAIRKHGHPPLMANTLLRRQAGQTQQAPDRGSLREPRHSFQFDQLRSHRCRRRRGHRKVRCHQRRRLPLRDRHRFLPHGHLNRQRLRLPEKLGL